MVQYTYRQTRPPQPARRLVVRRCLASGCRRRTPLLPFCPQHARSILGVRTGRTRYGCGLFATRAFRKNEVVAPYVGRVRSDAGPYSSPYAVDLGAGRMTDAAVVRGWAAMVNHPDAGAAANVEAVVFDFPPAVATRALSTGAQRTAVDFGRGRWVRFPNVLLAAYHRARPPVPFLVTTRPIARGAEILYNYGANAPNIFAIQHATTPSLC